MSDWQRVAAGRQEFEISDPALVPRQLAQAAAGCRYQHTIGRVPLRVIKAEGHRLALVPCFDAPGGSHVMFDLANLAAPRLVHFPVLAEPEGFTITARPGEIIWLQDRAIFEARMGSDTSCTQMRHIYRLDRTNNAFTLLRAEFSTDGCTDKGWSTVWEAARWPLLPQPAARPHSQAPQ